MNSEFSLRIKDPLIARSYALIRNKEILKAVLFLLIIRIILVGILVLAT